MNIKEFEKNSLVIEQRECYPVKSVYISGAAKVNGGNVQLSYNGSVRPVVIFDMGEGSVGGYTVFTIKSFGGQSPVLRLAYSDWYDYLLDEKHGLTGDFERGTCKYLGVEVPVLPANPGRFELYDINRTGEYLFPLIQGQQRFILLTLDTADTEIEIENLYVYYNADNRPPQGAFECNNEALNKLWNASVWTTQISSIDAKAWDVLNGKLLLRTMSKTTHEGTYIHGNAWDDYTFEFDGEISNNPYMVSGIQWMARTDGETGYVFGLTADGQYRRFIRKNHALLPMIAPILTRWSGSNRIHRFTTRLEGDCITISINGEIIDNFEDNTFSRGTIGFCQDIEQWGIIHSLKVYGANSVLLEQKEFDDLADYCFDKTEVFLADGAKRDRLPWSGDIDWGAKNLYYAFAENPVIPNTFKILMRHQTSSGYIWGTCYPEDKNVPDINDYGYYQSDIFSAWYVQCVANYYLYSGDKDTVIELYEALKDTLLYLSRFIESDGLFNQRYETSKGLWDHQLHDIGKFSYNNMVIQDSFEKGHYLAEKFGTKEDQEMFSTIADRMKNGMLKYFWNDTLGAMQKSTADENICCMSNSLALSIGFFDERQAKKVVNALLKNTSSDGKITALMVDGCFRYGYAKEGLNTLYQPGYEYVKNSKYHSTALENPLIEPYADKASWDDGLTPNFDPVVDPAYDFVKNAMNPVNWINPLFCDKAPATTWECMHYPPYHDINGAGWADRSHSDTGVAYVMSGYMLGVKPIEPGFSVFEVAPQTSGLKYAKGIVPTTKGDICVAWELRNDKMYLSIDHPSELCLAQVRIDNNCEYDITINGVLK